MRATPKWTWPVLAVTPVYVLSCLLSVGGLITAKPWGDVGQYERYARLVLDGQIPYADFYVEYPPGAFAAWILPAVVTDGEYLRVFKLEMALVGLAALFAMAWILARLGADGRRAGIALAAAAISPLALGHTFLNRFDPWPAVLVILALAALLAERNRLAGGLLSLGFAVKMYAAVAAPVTAVRIARVSGRRALVASIVVAGLVGVVAFGLFLVLGFGGVGNTYYTQAERHLQIETLGATPFLVGDELGLYEARGASLSPGSIDLAGLGPDVASVLTSVLQLALIMVVAVLYWRRPEHDERLVAAFAASVTAFAIFGKVLSPQFLVWLVFLVPLVHGRRGIAATGLLLAALGLTQLELQGYTGLTIESWAVWILLVRNLLLVTLFGVLVHAVADARLAVESVVVRGRRTAATEA